MILGYWQHAGQMTKTHIATDVELPRRGRPLCGVWILADSEATLFPGDLPHVECRRCLKMERKRARAHVVAIERRLEGKDGIQRDAFDKAR